MVTWQFELCSQLPQVSPTVDTTHEEDDVKGQPATSAHWEDCVMATSIFARIGTIRGESQDAKHRDEIDVLSWAWGVSRSGTAGHGAGGGVGKASFHDFTFTHHVDKASPLLMKACATGHHISDATITVRKPGKGLQEYLIVTMTDILVASVSMSVDADAGSTIEDVVLAFAKVDLEYKPQKTDGSLDAGLHFTYDLKAQKEG